MRKYPALHNRQRHEKQPLLWLVSLTSEWQGGLGCTTVASVDSTSELLLRLSALTAASLPIWQVSPHSLSPSLRRLTLISSRSQLAIRTPSYSRCCSFYFSCCSPVAACCSVCGWDGMRPVACSESSLAPVQLRRRRLNWGRLHRSVVRRFLGPRLPVARLPLARPACQPLRQPRQEVLRHRSL